MAKPSQELFKKGGKAAREESKAVLIEGIDYYFENYLMVFTAAYHLKRGFCCDNGCRHCPYKTLMDSVGNE